MSAEDHNCGGKRGGVADAVEFEATAQVADFGVRQHIIVPPAGTGSRGQEGDNGCAGIRALMRFPDPTAMRKAVGRIHPADAFPWLHQAVLTGRVVARAFGVHGQGGYIEREMKLAIQLGKERGRGFPFIGSVP